MEKRRGIVARSRREKVRVLTGERSTSPELPEFDSSGKLFGAGLQRARKGLKEIASGLPHPPEERSSKAEF